MYEDSSLPCDFGCDVCIPFAKQIQMDYFGGSDFLCHLYIDKIFVLEKPV